MGRSLDELARKTGLSEAWSHNDLIKLLGWFLHVERNRDNFSGSDIGQCYDALHLPRASNFGPYLAQLEKKKDLIKATGGYKVSRRVREQLEEKYGLHEITIQTRKALTELPAKMPNTDLREFLGEAIICYEHSANRAAIVMCWNLAFDHLCHYVLKHELTNFNTAWPKRFPKKHADARISAVAKREDFSELQESDVIDICRSGNIITADVFKILSTKLGTRNSAAHPSNVTFDQVQVEAFILDLVNNVVLLHKV